MVVEKVIDNRIFYHNYPLQMKLYAIKVQKYIYKRLIYRREKKSSKKIN